MDTSFQKTMASDEWQTPWEIVHALGEFDLDPCASNANHKAPDFYTKEDDGLALPWNGRVWCNPPFTNKRKIFERAMTFGKPFGLLMSMTWLNDSAPKVLFKDRDLQLFLFRDRVKFLKEDGSLIDNKITFASGFYCCDLLPKQIIIE